MVKNLASKNETYFTVIDSPIGKLRLIADTKNLLAVIFEQNLKDWLSDFPNSVERSNPILRKTEKQLTEYFQKKRKTFDLPLKLDGTEFQRKVWTALSKIRYGETRSYKQQGEIIKSPKAVRAIGRTNGANPICIILACHRVIGADGSLTGYAGGIKAKEYLLRLEGWNPS